MLETVAFSEGRPDRGVILPWPLYPKVYMHYRDWCKAVAAEMKTELFGLNTERAEKQRSKAEAFALCVTGIRGQICSDCGEPRPASGVLTSEGKPCNSRTCPHCARRRARKDGVWAQTIVDSIDPAEHPSDWRWKHITLTAQWQSGDPYQTSIDGLRERANSFRRAFSNIWKKYLKVKGAGAWFALEIAGVGNVHAHILYWGKFINKTHLEKVGREVWSGMGFSEVEEVKDPYAGVREVVKYIAKSPGGKAEKWFGGAPRRIISPTLVARWELAMYGARAFERFGVFRSVKRPAKEELEPIELAPRCACGCEEWIEKYDSPMHWIRWCHGLQMIALKANRPRAGPGDHYAEEEREEGQAGAAGRAEGAGRAETDDRAGDPGRAEGRQEAWPWPAPGRSEHS